MEELTGLVFKEQSDKCFGYSDVVELKQLKDLLVQRPVEINFANIVVLRKRIILGVRKQMSFKHY